MAKNTPSKILKLKLEKALKDIPVIVGKEGVKFWQSNFDKQEFQDTTPIRWARVQRSSQHKILQITGRLRRSIRVVSADSSRIVWGSDVPYASVHNIFKDENVAVKSHTRRSRRGNTYTVNAHSRAVKARPFMGKSAVFNTHNNKLIIYYLKKNKIL